MTDLNDIKKQLDKISPTVCYAKWHYNQINLEQGTTASCHNNPYHKIPENAEGLELFNTKEKIQQRQDMLQGLKPSGCKACWDHEEKNILSDRIWLSNNFVTKGIDNSTFNSNIVVPSYLGINLDNLCNFACSYCNNSLSSTWGSFLKKHGPFKKIYTDKAKRYQSIMDRFKQSPQQREHMYKRLFKAIKDNINHIQDIEFEGGEPSVSPNFWKFIEFLKTLDAKHLTIALASNMCPSNNYDIEKFNELPKFFKQVKITGSLENVGRIAEFTRYGTRWNDVEPNMRKLINNGIFVSVTNTMSALTVINYHDFLKWQVSTGLKLYNHNNFVKDPTFQSIDVLPKHLRTDASQKIKQVLDENKNYFDYHNTFEKLYTIVERLEVDTTPNYKLQQDLKHFYIQYCDRTKNPYDILGKDFADWILSIE